MIKVRVETEVPSGKYCNDCIYNYYDMAGFHWCILFHKKSRWRFVVTNVNKQR